MTDHKTVQELCEELAARCTEGEHRMAVAEQYARELEHRVNLLQRRLNHTEIELAQARESRDGMRVKLDVVKAKLDEMGFELIIQEVP